MIDPVLQRWAVWAVLAACPIVVVLLVFVSAPYGKHGRGGWGPEIGGRLGWIGMELPAVVLFGAVFATGGQRGALVPLVLLAMWMAHYVHRTFVFPFRLASVKPMPVAVVAIAFTFQVLNSYGNAAWIAELGHYPASWLTDPRFLLGAALFVAGEAVNLHADTVLIGLRKPGDTGYHIPRGGAYRWVTSANYLGEVVAWTGWAIATWSPAGLAFALFTVANLAPRAATHHAWYRERFPDYPASRRRLVPFVW